MFGSTVSYSISLKLECSQFLHEKMNNIKDPHKVEKRFTVLCCKAIARYSAPLSPTRLFEKLISASVCTKK